MQLLFKLKGPLLKPKPQYIFFEFLNIHISHFALHSMINMALKWHHKNISNKIIVFMEFWRSPNVLFDSFDYDCTLGHLLRLEVDDSILSMYFMK
jgi:hypothetical protein